MDDNYAVVVRLVKADGIMTGFTDRAVKARGVSFHSLELYGFDAEEKWSGETSKMFSEGHKLPAVGRFAYIK